MGRRFLRETAGFACAVLLAFAVRSSGSAEESGKSGKRQAVADGLQGKTGEVVKPADGHDTTAGKPQEKSSEKGRKKGGSKGEEKGGDRGGAEGKDSKKKAKASKGEGRMSLPLVKGHDSKGLNIPYFDDQGRRQMTFAIGVAELLDDDHVKMKEMRVETFRENEESEMIIDLPSSVLNLNTRVLKGQEGVTVKRSDFELTGRNLEFDTRTRKGNLVGEVRMLIYNQPNEDKPQESPRKSAP